MFDTLDERELNSQNILTLASVGDSVYDLLTRTHILANGALLAADLHKARVKLVNAGAQAKAVKLILPHLDEAEANIFRRGRNSKVGRGSVPQSANPAEYHAATALEALFGWLWLSGRYERLRELFGYITLNKG